MSTIYVQMLVHIQIYVDYVSVHYMVTVVNSC